MSTLELAVQAEQKIRDALALLKEAHAQEIEARNFPMAGSLQFYGDLLGAILICDSGDSGLESLVRKMGGV